ncbi:hypothetical protein [Litchfieldia alkalitelluris]|uniref:hypothetical protein n=1 Tax=Litchfieldia alkalitelluris TaxID=304268 RepID=UPI0009988DF1|nr:hypothetical protein [Litchfieldia alkalitelluris]
MKLVPLSLTIITVTILGSIFLIYTPGKTSESHQTIPEKTQLINEYLLYHSLLSDSYQDKGDQVLYEALENNILMSNQVVKELDFLLSEYQKTDALEGAVDAMHIAYEEVVPLLRDIQTRFDPKDQNLLRLKEDYKQIMTQYIDGLIMLLHSFENGETENYREGLSLTMKSKAELSNLAEVFK